jgi:hypothetical protein
MTRLRKMREELIGSRRTPLRLPISCPVARLQGAETNWGTPPLPITGLPARHYFRLMS